MAAAVALEDFIVLDPRVDFVPLTQAPERAATRPEWMIVNDATSAAAIVPRGKGIRAFLDELRAPNAVADLIAAEDIENRSVVYRLLESLVVRGYALRLATAEMPDDAALANLRATWRRAFAAGRTTVVVGPSAGAAEAVLANLPTAPASVKIDAAQAPQFFENLATAHRTGPVRFYELAVHVPPQHTLTTSQIAALRDLSASVHLEGGEDARALDLALVRTLVAAFLPVAVHVPSTTAALASEHVVAVITTEKISTLVLELEWDRIDAAPEAIYARFNALIDLLGDVRIAELPSDDTIIQNMVATPRAPGSEAARAFSALVIRDRALRMADMEDIRVWGQDPAAEELWVPLADDPLPNDPALLGLEHGMTLVDVAGGYGRVARRLVRHLGETGIVVSIEKEPVIADRAKHFLVTCEARRIQMRVGLGQRLPVLDESADAAVMEWGGEIQRNGLLGMCLREMLRVLRPGKRLAITYKLASLELANLSQSIALHPQIYSALREELQIDGLSIVQEKFWATRPSLFQSPPSTFYERHMPRLIDDLANRSKHDQPVELAVFVTVIAQKR